ncbi:DUF5343 domain-containing protein [Nesterenkonia halotolerans]|uniref:DUF5343 domain-containing protein n=1 Tax=Nesterenkonia halotolerans TaxID=225325 RepID=UPI003EE501F1
MASELPYMPSVTNVSAIFGRIREAGTPARFTHDFLKSTLGFGSSNDRSFTKILRNLAFLTADGTPTPRYNAFKGTAGGVALADGLREGWSSLFMADQRIHQKNVSEIQSTVKSVTGAGDAVARKIATTFKTLCDESDWTEVTPQPVEEATERDEPDVSSSPPIGRQSSLDEVLRLHHDIHIHLPPTSDVGVYRAIFKAMKSELM